MDKTDERILDLLKGNARMSFQELGDQIGMSRVAAKKRVQKLEQEGVIRGYNTCIYREDQYTAFIDITTTPEGFSKVLRYITDRTAYIRQIFRTTKENHLHIEITSRNCYEKPETPLWKRTNGFVARVYMRCSVARILRAFHKKFTVTGTLKWLTD